MHKQVLRNSSDSDGNLTRERCLRAFRLLNMQRCDALVGALMQRKPKMHFSQLADKITAELRLFANMPPLGESILEQETGEPIPFAVPSDADRAIAAVMAWSYLSACNAHKSHCILIPECLTDCLPICLDVSLVRNEPR